MVFKSRFLYFECESNRFLENQIVRDIYAKLTSCFEFSGEIKQIVYPISHQLLSLKAQKDTFGI